MNVCQKCHEPQCCCPPVGDSNQHWDRCACPQCAERASLRKRVEELACHHGEAGDNCGFNENEDYACWACYSLVKTQRDVLRKRVEELERESQTFEDQAVFYQARAEKAERELQRIEAKRIERQKKHARCDFKRRERMRQLQANLDAATFFADSLQARLDLHEAHDSACPCSGDGELHSYSCRDCTCGIGEEFREVLTRAEQAERELENCDLAEKTARRLLEQAKADLDAIKEVLRVGAG